MFELQFGIIGPAAQAEEAHNFIHDLRDLEKAGGWSNQLDNEPGLALIYERKWRPLKSDNSTGFGYDVITHAGAAVGNVFTYANAGVETRIGWNLPGDFGTSYIRPGAAQMHQAPSMIFVFVAKKPMASMFSRRLPDASSGEIYFSTAIVFGTATASIKKI